MGWKRGNEFRNAPTAILITINSDVFIVAGEKRRTMVEASAGFLGDDRRSITALLRLRRFRVGAPDGPHH
jgi:hypothetical protein